MLCRQSGRWSRNVGEYIMEKNTIILGIETSCDETAVEIGRAHV